MKKAFLAIGTNKGNKKENIVLATSYLYKNKNINVINISNMMKNPAKEGLDGGDFFNGAIEIETNLSPHELLNLCKEIEKYLGRIDSEGNFESLEKRKYESRTIDLDILFYDDEVIETKELVIPHPKIASRDFVLIPLNEIAPNLIHPIYKKKVSDLLKDLIKNTSPELIKQ